MKNTEIIPIGILAIIFVDIFTASLTQDSREFTDNNPFGIESTSTTQNFLGVSGTDSPLLVFNFQLEGVIAGFTNLYSYFQQGYTTISDIGNEWAGYGASLTSITGYGSDQPLNYWLNGIQIMQGICQLENGAGSEISYTYLIIGLLLGSFING